ncbi:MAG: hypothetical protein IKY45_05225 [Clostridia bacterium]|nr:hypothetical protein [Clostridia bacterium]
MNWKKEAANDLKSYPQRKKSLTNIRERINLLEEQFVSLKGISTDTPVMGGMSRQEEKMLNNISERECLEFSLKITERLVELTEKGLEVLEKRERQILEGFFFERSENNVERMCERFYLEKSRLYEIKDIALRKFTIAMYGTVEI